MRGLLGPAAHDTGEFLSNGQQLLVACDLAHHLGAHYDQFHGRALRAATLELHFRQLL